MYPATVFAKPVKICGVSVYPAVKVSGGGLIDAADIIHRKINHLSAVPAYKMIMRGSICVIMIDTVIKAQPQDFSTLR